MAFAATTEPPFPIMCDSRLMDAVIPVMPRFLSLSLCTSDNMSTVSESFLAKTKRANTTLPGICSPSIAISEHAEKTRSDSCASC
jgi:hypothetical protein